MSGEGSRNAEDDGVLLHQASEIRSRTETMFASALDLFRGDPEDVGATGFQIGYLAIVDVKSGDFKPCFREQERERKSDVAKSDDADCGGAGLQALEALGGKLGESFRASHQHVRYYCTDPRCKKALSLTRRSQKEYRSRVTFRQKSGDTSLKHWNRSCIAMRWMDNDNRGDELECADR